MNGAGGRGRGTAWQEPLKTIMPGKEWGVCHAAPRKDIKHPTKASFGVSISLI